MCLNRLRIERLRCLEAVDIALDSRCNVFCGANGAGKTSLLEAIHMLGRGRSFRTRRAARLVKRGANSFVVVGDFERLGQKQRLGVEYVGRRLSMQLNGAAVGSASTLAAELPVHVLDPGLHSLIDGGPSERRRYIDWGVFHVEHDYLRVWRTYRRVLGQRNAALKAGARGATLEVWSRQLVATGQQVATARQRYLAGLAEHVRSLGRELTGEVIDVEYQAGWPLDMDLGEAVLRSEERDRRSGTTEFGPHRAELRVLRAGIPIHQDISRGQQKLVAAALIIAQVAQFAVQRGHAGILLVDDPRAELDGNSYDRLRQALNGLPVQLMMTGLLSGDLDLGSDARMFHVEHGRVAPVYND